MKWTLQAYIFGGFLLASSSGETVFQEDILQDDIEWAVPSIKLPKPLSDMMATYMQGNLGDENGYIIITGGCDDPLGNQRDPAVSKELFYCTSVTNSTFKFDPFDNSIKEVAQAPHARYRHAAAVANGKLFVFGGRDVTDTLVHPVDMYDPGSDQWTTVGSLPEDKTKSDLSAWSWQNYIYIAGGFSEDYTATEETIRLDMNQFADNFTASSDTIEYETMYPMAAPRGDFHAVTLFGYAYAAGGITHTSNWCTSLTDFERYHMATDTWETLDDLTVGRADMAVAVLNGKIVATGGEVKPLNCETLLDPAFGSLPQDDVEVFIPSIGDSKAEWVSYMASPRELFRYAAAAVPAKGAIYTFGGQKPYDASCQCFASSDEILMAREAFGSPAESASTTSNTTRGSLSGGTVAGIAIACSAISLVLGLLVGKLVFSSAKSGPGVIEATPSIEDLNEAVSEADSSVNPKLA